MSKIGQPNTAVCPQTNAIRHTGHTVSSPPNTSGSLALAPISSRRRHEAVSGQTNHWLLLLVRTIDRRSSLVSHRRTDGIKHFRRRTSLRRVPHHIRHAVRASFRRRFFASVHAMLSDLVQPQISRTSAPFEACRSRRSSFRRQPPADPCSLSPLISVSRLFALPSSATPLIRSAATVGSGFSLPPSTPTCRFAFFSSLHGNLQDQITIFPSIAPSRHAAPLHRSHQSRSPRTLSKLVYHTAATASPFQHPRHRRPARHALPSASSPM